MVTESKGSIPEIALEGVSKRFRNASVAVEGISLTIDRGEFVTFLGPSGCGKSTLLKLVSGLSPVSAGTVRVNGMTPENARDLVSFIFQDATLLPWRTIEHNVGLGMELEHAAREARKERVARMLELVGLSHVATHYPRQLSGGMKMRASIARALVSRPRILLMDEPFAALDEMTRDRLNEELLRLYAEQKWTVLPNNHVLRAMPIDKNSARPAWVTRTSFAVKSAHAADVTAYNWMRGWPKTSIARVAGIDV